MNTAGGNDDQLDPFVPNEPPARDPSVRDVLAQLDRIEAMIGALNEQVGALNPDPLDGLVGTPRSYGEEWG